MKCPKKPYKLRAKITLNETILSAAINTDFMYRGKNKNNAVIMPWAVIALYGCASKVEHAVAKQATCNKKINQRKRLV